MGEPKLQAGHLYSVLDYLQFESESELKWEYYDGRVEAMSGGTRNHAVIVLNVGATLRSELDDRNCTPFGSEIKVFAESANAYLYPDAMVVCGDEEMPADRNDVLTNPTLIVEVFSPSTIQYHFIEKYDRYRRIPSLREYVLVSQDSPRVELRSSRDDWGHIQVIEGLDSLVTFSSIGISIPMQEIYRRVAFKQE